MRQTALRALIASTAAASFLALAGSAFAGINPRLSVGVAGQSKAAGVAVDASVGQSDDWVTAVGTTDPSVATQTTGCDNVAHLAALLVQAQGSDDSWAFPVFVDQTAGSETKLGPYKLVACFGPRAAGASNSTGNKLIGFSLALKSFAAPTASGDYKWRALWTPFAGDQSPQSGSQSSSVLNQAGSVESQTTTRLGAGTLLLAATRKSGARVMISGRLTVGGKPVAGATVAIRHGVSRGKLVSLGVAKTKRDGSFTRAATLRDTSYFQAGVTVAKTDLGAGGCAASFGVPCLDATVGGTSYVSATIRIAKSQ